MLKVCPMNRATQRLMVCLTVVGIITLNACDAGQFVGPQLGPDEPAFSLSPSELTLAVGESATIEPVLAKANGTPVNPNSLKWASTDESRVTVTRDGVLTGVAPGSAMVVASSGKLADTTRVRIVERAQRAGVNISPDTVVLLWLNATATLTAAVLDDDGTQVAQPGLTWKSLNPAIAQTDDMGRITAKGVGTALIVASAACCSQEDTAYARIHQVVDSVAFEQETVSLAQGSSVQLRPKALDRGGSTIPDATFSFKSGNEAVAQVSSDGVVTSQSSGTTTVTAASGDHSDDVTVTVTAAATAAPSAGRPNEPAGFVPWFVHNWQSFPATRNDCVVPASDRGYFIFCGVSAHVERATLIDDPGAPHGFGKSLRVHWPRDFSVGSGFFNYAIHSSKDRDTAVPLQKWYISTWVYLEPEADGMWETHFGQLRHFVGNRHITPSGGRSLFGWTLRGELPYSGSSVDWENGHPKRQEPLRDFRLWGYDAFEASTDTHATASPGMPLGRWVHMELLFDRTVKTSGPLFAIGEDGVGPVAVKYWENGELKMDRTYTSYMTHPFMELFFNLNQSGGIAPSADKYIRLSGTYVSGELYDGG
jgi:uncharacterized protein YjdB